MPGAWHFIHGHSGHIEDKEPILWTQCKGWGLCFYLRDNTHTWLHYAVPSFALFNWRVDLLQLKLSVGQFGKVSETDLWDGNVRLWQKSVDFTQGETDSMVSLGQEWEIFHAVGVSLKVEANGGDANFNIYAIGANFRQ